MALACVWHVLVWIDVHMMSTSTLEMLLSILDEVRACCSAQAFGALQLFPPTLAFARFGEIKAGAECLCTCLFVFTEHRSPEKH